MRTVNIFVLGLPGAATTAFVQAVRELQAGPAAHNYSQPYNYGRILIEDEAVMYLFAWSRGFTMQGLIETLMPSVLKEALTLEQLIEAFKREPFSDTGLILILDSTDPALDPAYKLFLQSVHALTQHKTLPYVTAFDRHNRPQARTPMQMRKALHIPDSLKVLAYDGSDRASAKKVVLELLALMPQDDTMRRVIEALRARL